MEVEQELDGAGDGMPYAVRADAEHVGQKVGSGARRAGAGGDDAAPVDDVEDVAVGGGEVEVVQRGQDAQAAVADQAEDVQLVGDVQVVGGFVEDQHPRLLGEGAGDEDPLLRRRTG